MRARAQKKKKAPGKADKTPPPAPQTTAATPPGEAAPHRPLPDPQQPPVVAPVLMPRVGLEVPARELAVVVGAIAAGGVAATHAAESAASSVDASPLPNTQRRDEPTTRQDGELPSAPEGGARPSPPEGRVVVNDAAEEETWRAPDEARLLVQSPRRLYLYWRFSRDPRELLGEALGPVAERFGPAVRLVDEANGEEGHPAPAGGNDYWFDVLPGRLLRADVGFHGEGLPFVRLISSNTVETPAVGVSRDEDEAPQFRVAEEEFGRVLEATGFAAGEPREEHARPDAAGRSDDPASHLDPARPDSSSRTGEPPRPRASSDTARPATSPRGGGRSSGARGGEMF